MARRCLCGRPALEGQASCSQHLRKRQAAKIPGSYGVAYQTIRLELLREWNANAFTVCHICKGPRYTADPWEPDHVLPVADGGLDTRENLRPAHRSCNRRRGARQRKRARVTA